MDTWLGKSRKLKGKREGRKEGGREGERERERKNVQDTLKKKVLMSK